MSEQGYERKKDFVNHALSRCVASISSSESVMTPILDELKKPSKTIMAT